MNTFTETRNRTLIGGGYGSNTITGPGSRIYDHAPAIRNVWFINSPIKKLSGSSLQSPSSL